MNVLGISAFYHDSAAALLIDGEIIAAAQEERFTRKKHTSAFPVHAIAYCLESQDLSLDDIDFVAFYDKPFLKFERLLETYLAFAPRGFKSFQKSIPIWIKEKLFQKNLIIKELRAYAPNFDWQNRLLFSEHHLSHAASAFFPSPFEEAAVLTMDGVGEWATTSLSIGKGNALQIIKEIHFPHSLGLLYSAFTYYTGFKVNSGEYKVMGLAPYGEPKYSQKILDHIIDVSDDGSFKMDMKYFDYCTDLRMTNDHFANLFGQPRRDPESQLTQFHMDIAASVQSVTEEIVLRLTRAIAKNTKMKNLCLAGGVALNCVANGKVLRDGKFDNIWVQPAAGDSGGALGAALGAYYMHGAKPRKTPSSPTQKDAMRGSYLGPEFEQTDIEQRLQKIGATFEALNEDGLISIMAEAIAEGKVVGWFQGRMEFGPRALGGRSILGDPRSENMQKTINLKIKYRESFRPFAPSVLGEKAAEWFDIDSDSPYMLMVADVAKDKQKQMTAEQDKLFGIDKLNIPRSSIPAVTHVDYSARIQTVHAETNPRYHALISKFNELTGCPILINTSFNVRGEPIVCTPEDAFHCFMGTEMDTLIIGNCILHKDQQPKNLGRDYKEEFDLD